MALSIILVFISAFGYAITLNQFQLFPLGLAPIFASFVWGETRYLSRRLSEYTEPVLREIAPMGKTEDIGNPDRLFYAMEISIMELESGYLVARAARNINIIMARLIKLGCCANTISTKFYRVFHIIDRWRPSEYICGLWVLSVLFTAMAFLSAFLIRGEYSFIGICLFVGYVVAVKDMRFFLNSVFADLYMTRLYYNSPDKHGDAFSAYTDTRFMDAT
jgi:hypothetical protein